MSFQTDAFGLAVKCNDIKIYSSGSTWAMKISQLASQTGTVRIITYSLPDLDYVKEQISRRPFDMFIICNKKFEGRMMDIQNEFPMVRTAVHPECHSKVFLIEPETLHLSSQNFGHSGWHESAIGLHSKAAHDWYVANVFLPLWNESEHLRRTITLPKVISEKRCEEILAEMAVPELPAQPPGETQWKEAIDFCKKKKPPLASILEHGTFLGMSDGSIRIGYPRKSFYLERMSEVDNQQAVGNILSEFLLHRCSIEVIATNGK